MHAKLLFCPLFKGISPADIDKTLQSAPNQTLSFNDKELIQLRGDSVNELWILLEGSVKGEMIDESGKLVKIEDIEAGMPLAIAFIFCNKNYYPVNISAVGKIKMLKIPKPSILVMMQSNPIFLKNFLTLISNKAKFLSDRIYFLSFKTIRQKIAHYILDECGTNISMPMKSTQQELADFFGIARPSLGRIFNELESEGIVKIEKKIIHIINKEKLIETMND
jgi:CRP-like cAMP-binding protein